MARKRALRRKKRSGPAMPAWVMAVVKDPKMWLALGGLIGQGALYLGRLEMRMTEQEKKMDQVIAAIEERLAPVEDDVSRRYAPAPRPR